MFRKLNSDYLSWIVLIGAFFVFLDVFFFNRGFIFSLIVATGMVYLGRKRMPRKTGKFLFWAGLILLILNVLNMLSVKFFILALLCFLIFQYANRRRKANTITPIIKEQVDFETRSETIIKEQPLFQNRLFGEQKTPEHIYEWNDVNIQVGVGNTVVDLSYTVLPKGETVIFIRNVIGKMTIMIPYDMEVSVHHSVLFGSARILDFYESPLINRLIKVETASYEQTNQKVKIFTSMMIGDVEVKRV